MKAKTLLNSEILALILFAMFALSLIVAMFVPVAIFYSAAMFVILLLVFVYNMK